MSPLTIVLVLLLSIEKGIPTSATPMAKDSNIADAMLAQRLQFGKDWYVYVKAHLFNTVRFKLCNEMICISIKSQRLSDVFAWIYFTSGKNHICDSVGLTSDVTLKGNPSGYKSHFRHISQPCGRIFKSYSLYTKPNETFILGNESKSLLYHIHVNQRFIINVTFLSLEARFHPSCLTIRAFVEETHDNSQRKYHWPFCPANPPQSIFSSGNAVTIHVQTSPTYRRLFMENNFLGEWIGNITLEYQIEDNDFPLLNMEQHQKWRRLEEYFYVSLHNFDITSRVYPAIQNMIVRVHIEASTSDKTTLMEHIEHLYLVYETKYIVGYFFHLQSFLGATFVIIEGSLICDKSGATLITYEGPPVDLIRMDSLLLRLQEWSCGHNFKPADRNMEVIGRIGDITAVLLIDKPYANFSLLLRVAVRAMKMNPEFALHELVYLANKSAVLQINFSQTGTYFYRVDIDAGKDFVNVVFKNMSFIGYSSSACTYGGIFIVHKLHLDSRHIGGVCSSHGAKQLERLYGRRGITFTERLIIYIKQYRLLTQIHATLTFSVDQCFGWINLFPDNINNRGVYNLEKQWGVAAIRENRYYGKGLNSYYHWLGVQKFLGMRRFRDNRCIKLQYIIFDNMRGDQLKFIFNEGKSVLGLDHHESIRPSLVRVAFWDIMSDLARFETCTMAGLRYFPDNRNDEPYLYVRSPEDGAVSIAAFTSKVGIDMSCLLFAGAFHIQVEDLGHSGQCVAELGGYLYDAVHPIILKGVCGLPNIHLNVGYQWLGIQTPTTNPNCCELDIVVTSVVRRCILLCLLYRTHLEEGTYSVHQWTSKSNAPDFFTYRGLCVERIKYKVDTKSSFVQSCIEIAFSVISESCDIRVHYRLSLHDGTDSQRSDLTVTKTCLERSCYMSPGVTSNISWNEAQAKCEDKNGSLVSVNSDAEWKMLTSSNLIRFDAVNMFYIGYRVQVSYTISLLARQST